MDKEYIINEAFIVTSLIKTNDVYFLRISYNKDDYIASFKTRFKYNNGIEYVNENIDQQLDNQNFDRFVVNFEDIKDKKFRNYIDYHKDIRRVFGLVVSEVSGKNRRKSTRKNKNKERREK